MIGFALIFWLLVLAFVAGLVAFVGVLFLARWWTRGTDKLAWLQRLAGEVPWAAEHDRHMRVNGEGTGQNSHEVCYVNRQDIAESGLKCPRCQTEVARRADFTNVVRVFINGQENEVIKCRGSIPLPAGRDADCPVWLVASPNTEHGDELLVGDVDEKGVYTSNPNKPDPPEFYRFTRITMQQAMREQYGMDVDWDVPTSGAGGLSVKNAKRPIGVVEVDPTIAQMLTSAPGTVQEPPASATADTALLPTIKPPDVKEP
jgi:hypothetical protein